MTTTVYFDNGFDTAIVYGLHQWDRDITIEIKGVNINGNAWVQFSMDETGGMAVPVYTKVENDVISAEIPGFVFEKETTKNYVAYAFVYETNIDYGKTIKTIKLNIKARPKPDDYVYTEPEKKRYDLLEERIKKFEENGVPGGGKIEIDSELSETSENPVQNKVVDKAFKDLGKRIPTKTSQLDNDEGFLTKHQDLSGYAEKATTLEGYGITDGATKEDVKKLSEEIGDLTGCVKSVNGFTADDNGEVTIEYDVGSDRRYRHDGLTRLPKTIEVYENDTYTHIPYVFLGENLWPAVEYVDGDSFDKNGVSFITDAHNIAVSGTATAGGSFILKTDPNSSIYQEIDGMFDVGDTLSLYVFSNVSEYTSPFVKVGIYDEGKSRIAYKQINIGAGKNFGSANLTVPEGAKYVRYDIAYNGGNTYNSVVFPVLVKYGTPVINNSEFSNGVANFETDSETDILCTAPYESIVFHKLGLKDYIDNRSNSVDFDMSEVEKTMSFVTPEMFGAYGDSVHDDTIAVQECIDYAIANGRRVIGGGRYLTSEPIVINATILMVDIKSITYSGTDAAVIVTGETNTLRFSYINCANGAGIRLKSDKITGYNNIYVAYLVSKKNCIEYITSVNGIVGNTLTFEKLECTGGENCIYQSDQKIGINHNNNNFIGGKLSRGEWGVYGAKGNDTYITCQFEGPKNGICLTGNGICRVISPRYSELKRLALDFNDPVRPLITGQGVMFAVNVSPDWLDDEAMRRIGFELSPSDDYLYPQSIDVSNAPLVFNNGGIIGKGYPDAVCIKAPLMSRKTRKLAQEFYVFGQHLIIKQPHMFRTLTITKNDIGYQGDYRTTDSDAEFDIYERFIISESDCDYTLPPSYDWIGFKEFIVEQSENTNCVFRDWRGTVIFNGVDYGVGTYKVTASCSSPNGDTYYNENQIWTIRRINEGDVVATSSHTD